MKQFLNSVLYALQKKCFTCSVNVYGTKTQQTLLTVFEAILTGRQSGQKLQCLYGDLMANNFSKIELNTICNQNFKILGRRLYSPSLKDVAWLEDTQLALLIFHKFVCNFIPVVNVNLPQLNFTDK